jgi:deoxyribonuclease-4
MHCHFSKIQYTIGGEKKHLTFEDTEFGPDFEPLAELLYKRSLKPTIICESDGTMVEDAIRMKNIYNEFIC